MKHMRADYKEHYFKKAMCFLTVGCIVLFILIVVGLTIKSYPVLSVRPIHEILFTGSWHPQNGEYGLSPFICGTLWVTILSLVIAVPLSLFISIYLSEYAHARIREFTKPVIDLLAGIPSVIYGLWGILIIVPLVKDHIAPTMGVHSSGYTILSASIVLAVMVLPIIIHISLEIFLSIPEELKEASLALGATRWETIKHVVIRRGMPGILAAIILGFSRAFGETMAVLMVAGNVPIYPKSPLDPAYPLPALIANNYGEMMSVPLYDSALMTAALILLIVVVFFNLASRYILSKITERLA